MDKAAKTEKKRNKVLLFLCAICVISNISYYPILVSNGWGRRLATAVWIVLGIFILLRMKIKFASSPAFYFFAVLFFLFLANTALATMVTGRNAFDNHFFQPVMIASAIFVCSGTLQKDIGPKEIRIICRAYYDCIALMSVPLFIFYLRGTDLSSRIYSYKYGKNEIAVLLLAALIIACTVYKPKGTTQRLFQIGSVVFLVADILLLRCRSVFLGAALLLIMLILNARKMNGTLRAFLILGVVAIAITFIVRQDLFNQFLNDIVYAGRKAEDTNDLSSGRDTQIQEGLEIFSENTLFGLGKYGKTLDSFYVSALVNYGIFSWPLITLSLLPLIWSFAKLKQKTDLHLCFFVLAGSLFLLALLEELAPFGPGTRCYILWLMWGLMVGRDIRAEDEAAKEQAEQDGLKNEETCGTVSVPTA